jgi:L-cysteine/cystine lyase
MVSTVTESRILALRALLPAVHATGYFNAGTFGPMPSVALEAADAVLRREVGEGRIRPGGYVENRERRGRLVALAAEMFGADEDEIALTHSAGEGLNSALGGIDWTRGDEVVTTNEEHPGLLLPLALLAHRRGVVTRYASIGNGGGDVVDSIARLITSRTRVIALSHVLWSTGAVLPLRDVADLAARHGAMVIVDAAQSAGHVPIDLHASGVDVYAMAGQKWLCGPEGTGFLYVRRNRFVDIAPTVARYGQFDPSGFCLPAPGAHRYESGEFSAPILAAQEATLTWLRDEVGLDWAYARTRDLGAHFHARISRIPGVEVITPANAMAGIVNFMVEGFPPSVVSSSIFDRGYTIRYVDAKPCVVSARASVSWWNTEEEVDGLCEAIAELAAAGSASA